MRYFIVFYHAQFNSFSTKDNEHAFIWGDLPHQGNFPNKERIYQQLKEMGFKWFHITGIKEVSKEDFEEYYK